MRCADLLDVLAWLRGEILGVGSCSAFREWIAVFTAAKLDACKQTRQNNHTPRA